MLHLIKQSPFFNNSLALCLAYLQNDDVILLLEDAVIAAVDGQSWLVDGQSWLEKLQKLSVSVFALQEDVVARSLVERVSCSIKLIDINGFVELTEQCETVISW